MANNVFTDDDAHVHHRPDSDGDAGQGHDVRIDLEEPHRDKAHQYRKRQQAGNKHRTSKMPQQDNDNDDRDQDFLCDGIVERAERFVDQPRAIVERNDLHLADGSIGQRLSRQARCDLVDLGGNVLNDFQRILTITNNHHTANRFSPFFIQHTPPQCRTC